MWLDALILKWSFTCFVTMTERVKDNIPGAGRTKGNWWSSGQICWYVLCHKYESPEKGWRAKGNSCINYFHIVHTSWFQLLQMSTDPTINFYLSQSSKVRKENSAKCALSVFRKILLHLQRLIIFSALPGRKKESVRKTYVSKGKLFLSWNYSLCIQLY